MFSQLFLFCFLPLVASCSINITKQNSKVNNFFTLFFDTPRGVAFLFLCFSRIYNFLFFLNFFFFFIYLYVFLCFFIYFTLFFLLYGVFFPLFAIIFFVYMPFFPLFAIIFFVYIHINMVNIYCFILRKLVFWAIYLYFLLYIYYFSSLLFIIYNFSYPYLFLFSELLLIKKIHCS